MIAWLVHAFQIFKPCNQLNLKAVLISSAGAVDPTLGPPVPVEIPRKYGNGSATTPVRMLLAARKKLGL